MPIARPGSGLRTRWGYRAYETRDSDAVLSPRNRSAAVTPIGARPRVSTPWAPGHGSHGDARLPDGQDTHRLSQGVPAGGTRRGHGLTLVHLADPKGRLPAASRELLLVRAFSGHARHRFPRAARLSVGRKSSPVPRPHGGLAWPAETDAHDFQRVRSLA